MPDIKEKFIVDSRGRKLGVYIDVNKYNRLLHYMEYMEDSLELKSAFKKEKENGTSLGDYLKKSKRKK